MRCNAKFPLLISFEVLREKINLSIFPKYYSIPNFFIQIRQEIFLVTECGSKYIQSDVSFLSRTENFEIVHKVSYFNRGKIRFSFKFCTNFFFCFNPKIHSVIFFSQILKKLYQNTSPDLILLATKLSNEEYFSFVCRKI